MQRKMRLFIGLWAALSIGNLASCQSPEKGKTAIAKENTGSATNIDKMRVEPEANEATAVFAGGCFWCTEASFERIKGVTHVISGYAGGTETNPTYKQVSNGLTSHAEAIKVFYDSTVINYPTLVDIFFHAHDPTQLNRQGPDVGKQYRSIAFYNNEDEKNLIDKAIKNLQPQFEKPIVTQVELLAKFYPAEEYHQDYYELHPENPYIQSVSRPKVEKVEKKYKDLLKERYK